MSQKKWILIGVGCAILAGCGLIVVAARNLRNRIEPTVKADAIRYLSERFDADVQIDGLHVRLPGIPQLQLWLKHGHGILAEVRGDGIVLHRKGRDEPAILSLRSFTFRVDVASLLAQKKEIPLVLLDGLELNVPPKADRPAAQQTNKPAGEHSDVAHADVAIDELRLTNTRLIILPNNKSLKPNEHKKLPLDFFIERLRLRTVGLDQPMAYDAQLHNPKPPGQIDSRGTFGPWNTEDPGASPLAGTYTFSHADLGVFKGIAGILESKGNFEGELAHVQVHGEAQVPDFRLKNSGNALPLWTRFDAEVDGTNGNTILKPVHARLAGSSFVTSGAVIRREEGEPRAIDLAVIMSGAQLEDFLRLAMKGPPFMRGLLDLNAQIHLPPLSGKVVEKLHLKGAFIVNDGKFLKSNIQEKLDSLSHKAQGEPHSDDPADVTTHMSGAFVMENQAIDFSRLNFGVRGADLDLTGNYQLDQEDIDFKGTLRLEAKVSETQTGVKRWLLKPLDPFFAKNGAGTFVHIKIGGTRSAPSFGLDLKR